MHSSIFMGASCCFRSILSFSDAPGVSHLHLRKNERCYVLSNFTLPRARRLSLGVLSLLRRFVALFALRLQHSWSAVPLLLCFVLWLVQTATKTWSHVTIAAL